MLQNVHLKNLALIREADIDFTSGLNILTGETGAGKSIIIGSVNIALGDKANKSFIRSGAEEGLAELLFSSRDERIAGLLESLDIPSEDGNILISRKITPDGSKTRINGVSVTLAQLRRITSLLVDIHGQHDHQSLLNPAKHLDIVDDFAGSQILSVKKQFQEYYHQYKELRGKYREFSQNPEELAKELSFLEFEIGEIEDAQLKPDEDIQLEAEYKKLSAMQQIHGGLQKLTASLFENADSSQNRISDGLRELSFLQTFDPDLKPITDILMDLDALSRDMHHELSHYLDSNSFQEERFAAVHQRLNEINRLKSKYGNGVADILAYQESLIKRRDQLKEFESGKEALAAQMEEIRSRINKCALSLSDLRKDAAKVLENQIRANLLDLNFPDVDFQIAFSKADKIYETGFDKVEFLISTNLGEPVKPLIKVASGGELSRVMLAIKASLADSDRTETLIFDEIDTGISGRTAQKVAEKLALLSRSHQLICITHLPQIAAMADTHFAIEKSVSEGSTISGISRLNRPDSILELARLLSGSEITETTIQSAEEMKKAAALLKSGN